MMPLKLHPRLDVPGEIALALFTAAGASLRITAKTGRKALRPARASGQTLRPGPETPIWNELVKLAHPHLRKRGTKAALARALGVPRQRLHDYLKASTACPDAERTLLLLCWTAARSQGRDLLG